jgi:hypothetical protein
MHHGVYCLAGRNPATQGGNSFARAPPESPMCFLTCLPQSPISTRTELLAPLLFFDLCVRLNSFTKPVYKRVGTRPLR